MDDTAVEQSTVIGGYGDIGAAYRGVGPDPAFTGEASLRRLVVYVSHAFDDQGAPLRATVELEWEDAIAGDGQPGSAEVEQASLNARLRADALQLQAGLLLVPFGLTNLHHEPPTLLSVERPRTETLLIPSTWRELGLGLHGQTGPLRYELDLLTALDPAGLSADGLAGARTSGAASPARAPALASRLTLSPTLGLDLGLSGYAADLGRARPWFDPTGQPLDLFLPLYGAALDLRYKGHGVELRALGALFSFPEADDLLEANQEDGSPYFFPGQGAVAQGMNGGYVELGYNLLSRTAAQAELLPFARLEAYDTQARMPAGHAADPLRAVQEGTYGLCYRPIPAVAAKADLALRDRRRGDDELQINAGLGFLF